MKTSENIVRMIESESPDEIIHWLRNQRDVGILASLYGVAERLDYHPEGDSGVHLEMAVVQAWRWCDSPDERAAVLFHDIGKAVTGGAFRNTTDIQLSEPKFDKDGNRIPSHFGHDVIGALLMPQLFDDLKLPNKWLKLSQTVAKQHQRIHAIGDTFSSQALVNFVQDISESIGNIDVVAAVASFVRCVRSDYNGRLGFEGKEYHQGNILNIAASAIVEYAEGARSRKEVDKLRSRRTSELIEYYQSHSPNLSNAERGILLGKHLSRDEKNGIVPLKNKSLASFIDDRRDEYLINSLEYLRKNSKFASKLRPT